MINKNTSLIIAAVGLIIVVGAGLFIFLNRSPGNKSIDQEEKERLTIEAELTPVELTPAEQQLLQDQGLALPAAEDPLVQDLQNVRASDELGAIEADLNDTDLSGLDADLETIDNDLSKL